MGRRRKIRANEILLDVPSQLLPDLANWLVHDGNAQIQAAADTVANVSKANAPKRSHDLERGIIVSSDPERSSKLGKIVYDIYMDPNQNDTFVKISKSGKRYYYPASREYGFLTRRKAEGSARSRVPGKYFMKTAAVMSAGRVQADIEQAVTKLMEEAVKKDV